MIKPTSHITEDFPRCHIGVYANQNQDWQPNRNLVLFGRLHRTFNQWRHQSVLHFNYSDTHLWFVKGVPKSDQIHFFCRTVFFLKLFRKLLQCWYRSPEYASQKSAGLSSEQLFDTIIHAWNSRFCGQRSTVPLIWIQKNSRRIFHRPPNKQSAINFTTTQILFVLVWLPRQYRVDSYCLICISTDISYSLIYFGCQSLWVQLPFFPFPPVSRR